MNDNEKLSGLSLTDPNELDPSDLNFECPDEIPRTFKQKLIRSATTCGNSSSVYVFIKARN